MSETLVRADVRARAKIIDADVHPWINGDIKGLEEISVARLVGAF